MMHPHIGKLLADARIDDMLATAERHRPRRLARGQRRSASKQPTDRLRRKVRTSPSIVDLSITPNADLDRDDQDQYVKA